MSELTFKFKSVLLSSCCRCSPSIRWAVFPIQSSQQQGPSETGSQDMWIWPPSKPCLGPPSVSVSVGVGVSITPILTFHPHLCRRLVLPCPGSPQLLPDLKGLPSDSAIRGLHQLASLLAYVLLPREPSFADATLSTLHSHAAFKIACGQSLGWTRDPTAAWSEVVS